MRERVTIAAPDGAVKQLDMPDGTRYTARGGGMYDVHPLHAKYVKGIGGFVPNVGPTVLTGPRCPGCGFASYFAKCSRCGTDRREQPIAIGASLPPMHLSDALQRVGREYVRLRRAEGGLR